MADGTREPLLLAALKGEPVERTPIWVMRQAGRYLPEYRSVRERTTFLGLCHTPELAAEVTCQPVRRFGMDAAILFSDILIPVEAMGVPLDFDPGPVLGFQVRSGADVDRLRIPDPAREMGFVLEAIRLVKREIPDTPLIGFAGAPFTLASYLIEGAGSKSYAETKRFFYSEPKIGRKLLQKLSAVTAEHLVAQVEAGAAVVQIFDSWAGCLSKDDYMTLALPFTAEVVDAVKRTGARVIVFAKGAHASLGELAQIGADALGIDWTLPLDVAGERTGRRVALQGNLDPAVLLAPKERIEREVQRVLNEARGLKGHVFNLGHGILPETPVDHMAALVDAVKRLSRRRAPLEHAP